MSLVLATSKLGISSLILAISIVTDDSISSSKTIAIGTAITFSIGESFLSSLIAMPLLGVNELTDKSISSLIAIIVIGTDELVWSISSLILAISIGPDESISSFIGIIVGTSEVAVSIGTDETSSLFLIAMIIGTDELTDDSSMSFCIPVIIGTGEY